MSARALLSSALRAGRRARHIPALLERVPLFREPLKFVRHEVQPVHLALPYTLRSSGLRVYLRHHTTDVGALNEVFLRELYRLPQPVRARLTALGRPPRILDLGAHVGMFGVWILAAYRDASLLSVEPDPLNATMLRRTVRANDRLDSWRVLEAAASNAPGRSRLLTGRGAASTLVGADGSTGSGEDDKPGADGGTATVEVELIDAFALFVEADLVKMDIEGSEWPILLDSRLSTAPIEAMVLEYHPRGCPDADPRACAEAALRTAGFTLHHIANQGSGMGMLWAWRERLG